MILSTVTHMLMNPRQSRRVFLAMMLAAAGSVAMADEPPVQVEDAWVRQSVKGQSGTGGFMKLTSNVPLTLVGVKAPVAKSAELHEMSMQGDVMRMRAIDALPLPAGKTVALQPGGHHLMLMGLKQPLTVGNHMLLTLLLRDSKGKVIKQTLRVPVLASAPTAAPASAAHPSH
jgi:copper(I)-binding protein